MRTPTRKQCLQFMACFTLFGFILVSSIHHELMIWVAENFSNTSVIYVSRWITYSLMTGTLLSGALVIYRRRLLSVFIFLIVLFAYGLSIRSMALNMSPSTIDERWAGVAISSTAVLQIDEIDRCYETDIFFAGFRPRNGLTEYSFIRGVWPMSFSEQGINRGLGFPKCDL